MGMGIWIWIVKNKCWLSLSVFISIDTVPLFYSLNLLVHSFYICRSAFLISANFQVSINLLWFLHYLCLILSFGINNLFVSNFTNGYPSILPHPSYNILLSPLHYWKTFFYLYLFMIFALHSLIFIIVFFYFAMVQFIVH